MDHQNPQIPASLLSACATCHTQASSGVFYPGAFHAALASSHLTQPTLCTGCHASSMPAGFVGPTASSPARTPPSGEMDHDAVAWSAGAPTTTRLVTADCAVCHATPPQSSTWATSASGSTPARFHPALDAARLQQPASCIGCHANTRPAAVVSAPGAALPPGVTFDHAAAQGSADCTACHAASTPVFASWTGGRYHASGSATPTTCLPCHSGERPTSTTGWKSTTYTTSPFDYGTSAAGITHGDGQDCALCHRGPGTGSWGGSQNWVGGRFTHSSSSPSARTCIGCHSSQRPDLQTGTTAAAMASLLGFDHSTSGTGDCIACHEATVTRGTYSSYTIPGGDWRGGVTYPVGPVSDPARNLAVTALVPTWLGSTILSFSSSVEQLPMPMDHASPALPSGVITTCAKCHTGAATGHLYPGVLHSSLATLQLAQPVVCASCHASSMPTGFVGPNATRPARVPASGEMKHDAVVWSQGAATTTAVVKVDCAVCHASPTQSTSLWTVGVSGAGPVTFHGSLTTAHATQPTSCIDCHANTRPSGAISAPAASLPAGVSFDHGAVAGGLGDCTSCHAASATSFTSWSGGRFHLSGGATPSACGSCHGGERPTTTSGWKSTTWNVSPFDFTTHGDALDCAVCHTGPGTGSWGGTQNWIGGSYGHGASTPAAVTCIACHSTQRPDLQPGTAAAAMATLLGFDHSTSGTGDCVDCHQATVTRGSYVNYGNPPSLTALPGGDWRGGLGYPGGLVSDPTRDVSLGVLIPRWAGVSIQSFAASQDTLLMPMDHQSPQVASLLSNCATCHAGSASGAFYPGDYHSSLANNHLAAPALCADCHAGSMPDGFVGPTAATPARTPPSGEMNHDAVAWSAGVPTTTHLVTADCSTCHASPTQALNASWATSPAGSTPTFHASLDAAKLPEPTSCIACHANTRPATVISAPGAALPAGVSFDHASVQASSDCTSCHAGTTTWATGRYHLAGGVTPTSCLPCHAGERPTATTGWQSATYVTSPFDYGTNGMGVTHGDGQDCALCHRGPGTGAWGGTQNWVGGSFAHAAPAGVTCIACHASQRPDLQPGATAAAMATLLGFDHASNGTGDCFGCHQATVAAGSFVNYGKPPSITALPGGDWAGGLAYPGAALVGSPSVFITLDELELVRTGTLVTGISAVTATVYAQMQHTAAAIPPSLRPVPPGGNCTACHTAAYSEGRFHPVLTARGLPQPTSGCSDCHAPMRPVGIIELAGSELQPMDHAAMFVAAVTLQGVAVTGVGAMDCSSCHNDPGGSWQGAMFHANIGSAVPSDCVTCHYPLMADRTVADLSSGTSYQMTHGSSQLTTQACNTCHTTALAAAPQLPVQSDRWAGGALHPSVSAQPTACNECHAVSRPAQTTQSTITYALALGGTTTNGGQWMSHGSASVTGKDCVSCHRADAKTSGSAWSRSASFHAAVAAPATCAECHGLTNGGGATVGTNNNMPAGSTNSTTLTTASADPTTGVRVGTLDQVTHADVNVTGHDCSFCHTQAGASTAPGVAGHEWAQASFHVSFTAGATLMMNGTTGRCSNCHFNLKPGSTFLGFDHSAITNVPGSQDCSACHSWPGTGTAASPNWLGAAGAPLYIAVGGFNVSQPPATTTTVQPGINNLPHPTVGTRACTACHTQPSGGKPAIGYDHASSLASSQCAACHEAGTSLVGTRWNGATTQTSGAGDSRPYTLKSIIATRGGNTLTVTWPNHFYKNGSGVVVDCSQCHMVPAGTGAVTTGTAYTSAWTFPHTTSKMTNPSTCVMCHTNGIPN
jgi:cytochrome c551/c552